MTIRDILNPMKPQNFEIKNQKIHQAFLEMKQKYPERLQERLAFSWSNWGFGLESLTESAARLQRAGLRWIELQGNHHSPDLGYQPEEVRRVLTDYGIQVSGLCGIFSPNNDLSSNNPYQRQAAMDYIRREVEFGAAVGAYYLIVVPGAVGRTQPYDGSEFERSADSLRRVADEFSKHGVRAAIEPIRSAEVSLVHTVADAKRYIMAVNHPGITHINGDVFHMQAEEAHIGEAILEAGAMLTNLHLADSNRGALGEGSLDLDTVIRALYLIGFNRPGCFVTPEPLGPGGDPYPAMHGHPQPTVLEHLVQQTVTYFHQREEQVLTSS